MRTRKIKGISKKECCCEQKIAYNFAFARRDFLQNARQCDDKAVYEKTLKAVEKMILNNEDIKKYNIEAVLYFFNAGIERYLDEKGSGIFTSYEQIGKIFSPEV